MHNVRTCAENINSIYKLRLNVLLYCIPHRAESTYSLGRPVGFFLFIPSLHICALFSSSVRMNNEKYRPSHVNMNISHFIRHEYERDFTLFYAFQSIKRAVPVLRMRSHPYISTRALNVK